MKCICDGFSTGNLCDSVKRKLENESERPGLEFQLWQTGRFETFTAQLTSSSCVAEPTLFTSQSDADINLDFACFYLLMVPRALEGPFSVPPSFLQSAHKSLQSTCLTSKRDLTSLEIPQGRAQGLSSFEKADNQHANTHYMRLFYIVNRAAEEKKA